MKSVEQYRDKYRTIVINKRTDLLDLKVGLIRTVFSTIIFTGSMTQNKLGSIESRI